MIHYLGLSDHETAQSIEIKVNKPSAYSTWFENRRDYSKNNIQKFCDCIAAMSIAQVYDCNFSLTNGSLYLSYAFIYFYDLLCLFYYLCFPILRVKINNRPVKIKWLTKGIKKSCKTKRLLYLKYRQDNSSKLINKAFYKKYSKI